MTDKQHRSDADHQDGQHLLEGSRLQPRRPTRTDPGTEQTAGQQIQNDGPMRDDIREGNRGRAERQSRCDDNQADGLVQDYRLQGPKAKQTDQKRQAELRATQTDQPSKRADDGPPAEGGWQIAVCATGGVCRHTDMYAETFRYGQW